MVNRIVLKLSREKLREGYSLSPEMRLAWLEEANEFVYSSQKALSKKKQKQRKVSSKN